MHVVITGASSGIGASLARELGKTNDDKLTLLSRRREPMEKLAKEISATCFVRPHDLSDHTRATEWIAEAEEKNGAIDVMINNAGVENTGLAAEADVEECMALMRTNVLTPMLIARALLPKMIERRAGTIVNIASVASFSAMPLQAWYGASKSALGTFSEVLRSEVRGHGVHVLTVYPGPIKTPMGDAAYEVYGGRKGIVGILPEGTPEELAIRVRRAIERKRKRLVYPAFYHFTRIFPWLPRMLADTAPLEVHKRSSA